MVFLSSKKNQILTRPLETSRRIRFWATPAPVSMTPAPLNTNPAARRFLRPAPRLYTPLRLCLQPQGIFSSAKKNMHTSSRKVTLKWPKKGSGSILRPLARPEGYFVAYKQGVVKYSRKPITERTSFNDYGTLLKGGKLRRPHSDFDVVDTRGLIQ